MTQTPQFETALRGYNQQQVETYIAQFVEKYNRLVNETNAQLASMKQTVQQVNELRTRVEEKLKASEEARQALTSENSSLKEQIQKLDKPFFGLGEAGQALLDQAEKTKNEIIANATEEASTMRRNAKQQSDTLISKATADAKRIMDNANDQATQTIDKANRTANEIQSNAKRYADEQSEIARKALEMQDEVRAHLDKALSDVTAVMGRRPTIRQSASNVRQVASQPVKKPDTQSAPVQKPVEVEPEPEHAEPDDETRIMRAVVPRR